MSGTESSNPGTGKWLQRTYTEWDKDILATDLKDFESSAANKDAAAMLRRGIRAEYSGNWEGLGPGSDPTHRYFDRSGQEVDARKAVDSLAAFSNWKSSRAKTNKEYLDYVDKKKSQPGRSATILTPMSGPEGKTVIG
jgi:hypothetical protein